MTQKKKTIVFNPANEGPKTKRLAANDRNGISDTLRRKKNCLIF